MPRPPPVTKACLPSSAMGPILLHFGAKCPDYILGLKFLGFKLAGQIL
jgi:hypothetical protein